MTMTTTTTTTDNKRLLLVSVPRTASNFLVKILNIHHQPKVRTNAKAGYFFYDAYMASSVRGHSQPSSPNPETPNTSTGYKTTIRTAFQECLSTIEQQSKKAQEDGKMFFTKEHAFWFVNPAVIRTDVDDAALDAFRLDIPGEYGPSKTFTEGNNTVLPDEYLRTWQIAFVIRHPALAWPSMYRAMQKIAKLGFLDDDGVKGASFENMTLKWTRMLFDWCYRQPDEMKLPVIIDAHDVIHHPAAVLQFCEKTGLDPAFVQMEWEDSAPGATSSSGFSEKDPAAIADSSDKMNKEAAKVMLSTLNASKGVVKDKAPMTVDIPAEAEKWRAEFGDDVGALIEKAVWDAMPDYEYLKEKCVKPVA